MLSFHTMADFANDCAKRKESQSKRCSKCLRAWNPASDDLCQVVQYWTV